MSEPIMEFTIVRDKWLRGEGGPDSSLLNDAGRMCCLGFFAEACGAKDIRGVTWMDAPFRSQVPAWAWDLLVKYGSDDTDYAASLTKANDNKDIGDDEREAKLTELFAEAGIKVNFV